MSTINKTTLQRYNGTDWDSIYFASSSDIISIGNGFTAAADTTGFKIDDVIESSDSVNAIITRLVNRMATLDTTVLPALQDGSTVSSLDASKLTGIVSRTNLPSDVGGKVVEVADEDAKAALTSSDVNIGDIVKVAGGAVYVVSGLEDTTPSYVQITDETSAVQWSRLTGTPTTIDGYGITDAVYASEKATAGGEDAAGKIATANTDGKLAFDITGDAATLGGHDTTYYATASDLSATNTNVQTNADAITAINTSLNNIDASQITSGTLSLSVVPKAALERIYVVENEAALATLTEEQVQNGDTVKVNDVVVDGVTTAGPMYLVSDSTKLGTADYMEGLVVYTAGTAAAVDWSGVNNKPTTLAGYGITDAVSSDLVTDTATAGKLLTLNADGKLEASITGDAVSLAGQPASYYATAQALTDLNTAYQATVSTVSALATTVNGSDEDPSTGLVSRVKTLEDEVGDTDTVGTILYNIAQLQAGTSVQAIDASKLTGTVSRDNLPADIGGVVHSVDSIDAAYTSLTADNTNNGDWVKTADGVLYFVSDNSALASAAGYTLMVDVASMSIDWSKITNTPTTLAGYGITDAVSADDVIVDALDTTADIGGKLVRTNSADKKLHVNIAGDAMTLETHPASYFATKTEFDALAIQVPQLVTSTDDVENAAVGQMVMVTI